MATYTRTDRSNKIRAIQLSKSLILIKELKIPFKMDISSSALVMNIAGSEWIIIILLGLILLFGTKKLPQFSRTMGKAIGEYEKAKELFRHEMEEASEKTRTAGKFPKIISPVDTERKKLESIASSLGIEDYASLTDEELRTLISKRMAD
jgi:sec-independent protein translocase protein TatA